MKLYPNCKINLGLNVIRKRADGYHDLETIFYPVKGLHDELEVIPIQAEKDIFTQQGLVVDCPADNNLIIKCLTMFREEFGDKVKTVEIRFKKDIPFGAGLGGGSSDAAHMAIALNELFSLGLSKAQLAERVAHLGADCAFFIYNTPCFAEGIGDQLTEIPLSLSGLHLVMIKPEVGVSTRDAYAGIQVHGQHMNLDGDWKTFTNDFETTVFARYPEIETIKKRLLKAGAIYAAMSGSGSTVFGLFENDTEGCTMTELRRLNEEFASMVIFDDTLA